MAEVESTGGDGNGSERNGKAGLDGHGETRTGVEWTGMEQGGRKRKMKKPPPHIWTESQIIFMLDFLDEGDTYLAAAKKLSKKFRIEFTLSMVSGMMFRLRKRGLLR